MRPTFARAGSAVRRLTLPLALAAALSGLELAPAHAADEGEDLRPPTVTIVPDRAADANGWYRNDVTLFLHATDNVAVERLEYASSGATEATGALDPVAGGGLNLRNEGATHVVAYAVDTSGNDATTSFDVVIDRTDPAVQVDGLAEGDELIAGSTVMVTYTCSDGLSGVASCSGSLPTGAAVPTSALGDFTFTATATDRSGRTSTRTIHYAVVAEPRMTLVSPPKIDGTGRPGETLTAVLPVFDPAPAALACKWHRGVSPEVIGEGPTYVVKLTDVGSEIHLICLATKPGYPGEGPVSEGLVIAPADLPDDTVTGTSLGGTGAVGSALTADFTVEPAEGQEVEVRWTRDGERIPDATGTTYVVTDADRGHQVAALVIVRRPGFHERSFPIGSITATAEPRLITDGTLRVSGVARVGGVLQATVPKIRTASGATATIATRVTWLRDGVPMAVGTRYVVKAADAGHRISARLTASSAGFPSLTSTSAPTAVVAKAVPVLRATSNALSRHRVRLTITATAPGAVVTGPVVVKRGAKVVARGTVRNGRLTLMLTKQKVGRATYVVTYAGGAGVITGRAVVKVTVR